MHDYTLPVLLIATLVTVPTGAATPPADVEPPPTADWRVEPFEWRGELAAVDVVAVRNPYGDVRARRAEEGAAVYAMMQRHRQDPRAWTIAIDEREKRLAIEVVPAAGAPSEDAATAAAWAFRRVDMTVYVPAGAKLEVETAGGLIEAKRLRSDVEARSASGEVVITTAGSVDARSDTGAIRYSCLDAGWAGSARLATRTGDVAVVLPRDVDAELTVRTRGAVAGDGAPLAAATREDGGPLHAVLGTGANPVTIESESGNVEIRTIPR